mgnify:CR=1 FL=1
MSMNWQFTALEQIASILTRDSALSYCYLDSDWGEGPHKPVKTDSVLTEFALARTIGVARATVQNRIGRMLSTGVIQRFTVALGQAADEHHLSAVSLLRIEGR